MLALLVSSLLAPSSLPAPQDPTCISPAAAAAALGGTNNNAPFSVVPTHYQQVHDRETLSATGAVVAMRMRFRMASGFANYAGKTIDVELFLAQSPNPAATMSTTFANNVVPASESNVFTRKMVALPQVPDNSWSIAFPFDTPFVHTGSAHLGWRAVVWGNSNGNAAFTYPLDAFSATVPSSAVPNGPASGCASATGSGPATHTATVGALGGVATFTGSSQVAAGGLPALLALGASASTWGSLALPVDLGPYGAPGCWVRNDVALTLPGTTQAGPAGSASWMLNIPPTPSLAGGLLYSQCFFVQASANAFGLFASNGLAIRLAGPLGISRMYYCGNPQGTFATVTGIQFGLAIGFN